MGVDLRKLLSGILRRGENVGMDVVGLERK